MCRPVQLNGDAAVHTERIDNVSTYAELPSKLLSQHLSPLKIFPQDASAGVGLFLNSLRRAFSGAIFAELRSGLTIPEVVEHEWFLCLTL
jgi:hypothetical protein